MRRSFHVHKLGYTRAFFQKQINWVFCFGPHELAATITYLVLGTVLNVTVRTTHLFILQSVQGHMQNLMSNPAVNFQFYLQYISFPKVIQALAKTVKLRVDDVRPRLHSELFQSLAYPVLHRDMSYTMRCVQPTGFCPTDGCVLRTGLYHTDRVVSYRVDCVLNLKQRVQFNFAKLNKEKKVSDNFVLYS